jgi:hypothetical protein
MIKRIAATTAALFALALGYAAPAGAQFWIGVGTHFGQNRGDVTKSFDLMRNAGIQTFRDELYWSMIETRPGVFTLSGDTARVATALDGALAAALEPVLILDYGNGLYDGGGFPLSDQARGAFAAYARFAAATYRGKIRYYEVWNEWNGGMGHANATTEMKSPESYLRLLQATHAAVKQADPSAVVIGGAVDGNVRWTERLVELGGMKHMDVLSIHPYMFHAGKNGTPEQLVYYLADLGKRLAALNGGAAPPVFITETGWPTGDSHPGSVSPETAANYLVRAYLGVRTMPFVQGMWWYELQNSGTDPRDIQHAFGLTDANLEPKPAYHAMRVVAPLVSPSVSGERVPTAGGEWLIRLRHADGSTVLGLWVADPAPKKVQLSVWLPSDAWSMMWRGGGYQAGESFLLRGGWNRLELELSGSPVLILAPRTEAVVGDLQNK